MREAPEKHSVLYETLKSDAAFLRRYLEQLVHVPVKDERGHVVNGFAAVQIPDWAVRQRLEDIDAAIQKADEDFASTCEAENEKRERVAYVTTNYVGILPPEATKGER